MRKFDFISIGLMIILVMALFLLYVMFKSESRECIKNPFVYGAGKMKNIECNCYQFQEENDVCPARFSFNDTTFNAGFTECIGNKGLGKMVDYGALNITK